MIGFDERESQSMSEYHNTAHVTKGEAHELPEHN